MAKTALITGATSGIGEAIAYELAQEGYNLIITGRRAIRLRDLSHELADRFGVEVQPLAFDIRDRRQCETQIKTLSGVFAQIDVLVNNAGLAAGLDTINKGDYLHWDAMIDTNIKGLLYMTRKVSAGMIERGGGHIINIGSISGTHVYEGAAVYCATKHAVHALSQGMRIDFLKHRIKVTEIRPGMAETEFSVVRFDGDRERASDFYRGVTTLTATDIAESVVWALSQPAHVNIDEIVLTPLQQANVHYLDRCLPAQGE